MRDMSTQERRDQQTSRPAILVVDSDVAEIRRTAQALARRFGADYSILSDPAASEGLQVLSDLASNEADVALVAAALRMTEGVGMSPLAGTFPSPIGPLSGRPCCWKPVCRVSSPSGMDVAAQ